MEPFREIIQMPDTPVPVRAFIRSYKNEERIYVHPHWHSAVEVLYILKGKASQQINNNLFDANEGNLVIIQGDQIHSTYTSMDKNNEILVIQFEPEIYKFFSATTESISFPELLNTADSSIKEAIVIINDIIDEITIKNIGYELFIKAAVLKLAAILLRNFNLNNRKKADSFQLNRAKDMLKNTFKLIDENYSNTITLNQAVIASNLSVPHFCRLFKKYTGKSFINYLTFYRLSKAEEMLLAPKSITEIAFDCGFGSITSFNRAFKKFKGCKPSEYRQQR